ncbi:hypothetical protein [Corynebacterium crudilactis]|uniref:Cardiolipin synthase N-terminal domain-containing protein n=1 Tax=Corynebacterium crudilactis TaxID=1652495 RepID=A0A172QW47_9CORY|nr:hypothetical protein [Corynebacterium crudilactis]ANE04932.1 hypothetical protein ccrud_12480 [Corynebacterium crudilactis]
MSIHAHADANSLPIESGNAILFPPMYDVIWSLVPLVHVIMALVLLIVEVKTRGWRSGLIWGAVFLFLPIFGLFIWAINVLLYLRKTKA